MNLLSPRDLEFRLFAKLASSHPTVFGHVQEVHADAWLSVFIYAPGSMSAESFKAVTSKADQLMAELWPEPPCIHSGSFGKNTRDEHCYTFWLPVPPQQRASDFKLFSFTNPR